MTVKVKVTQLSSTFCDPMDSLQSMEFSRPNTGVGSLSLLQRIFPTQESNPHLLSLLRWQAGSLPLVPPGKLDKDLTDAKCLKPKDWIKKNACWSMSWLAEQLKRSDSLCQEDLERQGSAACHLRRLGCHLASLSQSPHL